VGPHDDSNVSGFNIAPAAAARFSLASLMLVVTLAAVLFGVIAMRPGIGIALAVLSLPALVRTVGIQVRRREAGAPLAPLDRAMAFLASLAVATVIAVAAGASFVAICFPVGLAAFGTDSAPLAVVGWILGIVAGLVVGFFLARWLWPATRTWLRAKVESNESESVQHEAKDEP
jgi:hypothetical protein